MSISNEQYKRNILLSLDTIMKWVNNELPDDDIWGYLDGYGSMPAYPEQIPMDDNRLTGQLEYIVDRFMADMKDNLPDDICNVYIPVLQSIPYEEI